MKSTEKCVHHNFPGILLPGKININITDIFCQKKQTLPEIYRGSLISLSDPVLLLSTPSQITVDCKSIHFGRGNCANCSGWEDERE